MADLVQPIVVLQEDDTRHEAVVRAAADASVGAYQFAHPNWERWLAGRFTKTVRRARPNEFAKVIAAMEALGFPYSIKMTPHAQVAAFAPLTYEEFPKALSRTQVAGTDFEHEEAWGNAPGRPITVYINPDVKMTTGKTAALVAHGLFGWRLRHLDAPWPVEYNVFSYVDISDIDAEVTIADAGFTEIDPGTITVKVTSS